MSRQLTPNVFRLLSLRGAVQLESLGMRRSRTPSAKTIACNLLKISKRTSHEEVIHQLTVLIEDNTPCQSTSGLQKSAQAGDSQVTAIRAENEKLRNELSRNV